MAGPQNNTFPCPFCGADVREGAKVCRACGASDDCGWNADEDHAHAGPDDDFDYDEFVAREFANEQPSSAAAAAPMWVRLVILAIVISFLLSLRLF